MVPPFTLIRSSVGLPAKLTCDMEIDTIPPCRPLNPSSKPLASHGSTGARSLPTRSRSECLRTLKCTVRLIPSWCSGVSGSFSLNVRNSKSRRRMKGACALSKLNRSSVTCKFSHSAPNAVMRGEAMDKSAPLATLSGNRPCRANHAGTKIAGLNRPRKTSAVPPISGSIRTAIPRPIQRSHIPNGHYRSLASRRARGALSSVHG